MRLRSLTLLGDPLIHCILLSLYVESLGDLAMRRNLLLRRVSKLDSILIHPLHLRLTFKLLTKLEERQVQEVVGRSRYRQTAF